MGNRVAKHVYAGNVLESSTYYVRDAQGNVMGVYEHKMDAENAVMEYKLIERNIYGSAQVGICKDTVDLNITNAAGALTQATYYHARQLNHRQYSLSNHLGNVLTTLGDGKAPVDSNSDGVIDYYTAYIISVSDYSPFGVELANRTWSIEEYRNGFQKQEKDKELWEGAMYYKYRVEDPRLGRFFSVDPLYAKYPYNSNYAFSENVVINSVELEGMEKFELSTFSFAPFDYFSFGYAGDGQRKFCDNIIYPSNQSKSSNYRIGGSVSFDLDRETDSQDNFNGYGSYSYNKNIGGTLNNACFSQAYFSEIFPSDQNNDVDIYNSTWSTYCYNHGSNCASPVSQSLTPEIKVYIDVFVGIRYGDNPDSNPYILDITGYATGTRFPSNEIFIKDSSGNKLMLGISGIDGQNKETAAFTELWTNVLTEEKMSRFKISVNLDSNYNFESVNFYTRNISINDWTKMFSNCRPDNGGLNTDIDTSKGQFNYNLGD